MRDSMMPARGPGGNKTVIFLLIGGSIIMLAAVVLILKQRDEKPVETPPVVEEKPAQALPTPSLVATKPTRLLNAETDSAAATDTQTEDTDKKKSGRRRRSGEPTGEIDPKVVNKFINARFSQVKACYERRLKINSFLEGKLDLNIGILESGKVNLVSVNRDTVRDAQMLDCVKSTIRGWKFPQPEGGRVVIGKTFNFKKKGI